jgi:hypothetical protein
MSTAFRDAVLAHSPIIFHRNDETGSAVDGMEIADSSGNDRHMELRYLNTSVTLEPLGKASAVETDDASRSLQCKFLSSSLIGGDYSYAELANEAALNVSQDFTLFCFVKSHSGLDLASFFPVYGKKGQYQITRKFNASAGSVDFYYSGLVVLSDGETYHVESDIVPELETFYSVALVRSGNALAIYVNAQLRGLTTLPGLANASTSNPFVIGGRTSADVRVDQDTEECFFVGSALSQPEIQIIYEAALNSLNMAGRCDIRITATLSGDTEPDPEPFAFRHNWDSTPVERLSARSSVFKSKDATPHLASQASGVRRELDYSVLLQNDTMRRRFNAKLWTAQGYRFYVPIWADKVQLSGMINAGETVFTFDTRYLDFDAGNHFMVWESEGSNEVVEIEDMDSSSVTGATALENGYTNPFIVPVRRAYLPPNQSLRGHTAAVEEMDVTARLLAEDEPLSPNRVTPWVPAATYQSYELFGPQDWQSNDYSEPVDIELLRDADLVDFETGIFHQRTDAPGTEGLRSYRMLLDGREAISRFLGWWYYRTGRTVPFWMPSFQSDFDAVSLVGSTLTVSGHLYTDYYNLADARKDLVFVYNDDTIAYRRITAASKSGANDALTLSGGSGTLSLSNLRYICFLKLGILGADLLEIAWETDSVARVVFTFSELLTTPEVPAASPSVSPSASVSPSVSRSVSPSASQSPSASASPSSSVSASASLSLSPSASASPSASQSPSPSRSASPSASQSPSASTSPSASQSPSVSPSVSPSASQSPSASSSPSA